MRSIRRHPLVIAGLVAVLMAYTSPAVADIPGPTDVGTGVAVIVIVGLLGLAILGGAAVLLVWGIMRLRRRDAQIAEATPVPVSATPVAPEAPAEEGGAPAP